MLGDIYYTLNYIKEGVKLFEYIVEIQPDDYNGYYNLAVFQYKQNKFDRALYNYKKVLELDEKNINAIFNIGNIFSINTINIFFYYISSRIIRYYYFNF